MKSINKEIEALEELNEEALKQAKEQLSAIEKAIEDWTISEKEALEILGIFDIIIEKDDLNLSRREKNYLTAALTDSLNDYVMFSLFSMLRDSYSKDDFDQTLKEILSIGRMSRNMKNPVYQYMIAKLKAANWRKEYIDKYMEITGAEEEDYDPENPRGSIVIHPGFMIKIPRGNEGFNFKQLGSFLDELPYIEPEEYWENWPEKWKQYSKCTLSLSDWSHTYIQGEADHDTVHLSLCLECEER